MVLGLSSGYLITILIFYALKSTPMSFVHNMFCSTVSCNFINSSFSVTRQDWQAPDKIIDPNVDLWFTDGLGIHDCFGVGIFGAL